MTCTEEYNVVTYWDTVSMRVPIIYHVTKAMLICHFIHIPHFWYSQCDKTFLQNSFLIDHLKKTGDKPYRWSQYDKEFTDKKILMNHFRIPTVEKTYQCNQCEKPLKTNNITEHLRIHTIGIYYITAGNVKRHL